MNLTRSLLGAMLLALATAAAAGGDGLLKPKKQPQFLPVDEAFEIQPLELGKDGRISVAWRVAPGYYLYRHRMSFEVLSPQVSPLGKPQFPAGEKHVDEYFGEVEIYRGDRVTASLPIVSAPPKLIKLKVGYQGCADAGLCYPPQERTLELVLAR